MSVATAALSGASANPRAARPTHCLARGTRPSCLPSRAFCTARQSSRPQTFALIAAGKGSDDDFDAGGILSQALKGSSMDVDPAISAVSQYLRSEIGIDNRAELMRIVDITMNTNSIYKVALPGPRSGPRGSPNTLARKLDVETDIKPVVALMQKYGLETSQELKQVILAHPPVLCYSTERIEALFSYLEEVGVEPPVARILLKRPTLVGLKADENLKKIIGYFQARDYSTEEIVHMLETSI